ncbi:hypothetical protein ACNASG_21240 [Klebsiella pneumoniae]|uniref:hypothetical protein n=1 Tax=Klebsiella pneumoniae TaxID=573 RepID=UPI002A003358|nr:hypothetical protein [Klebsiella pneumoniae]EJD3766327.1 hypothetical protein [Klebsiella pneumoniae]MCJ4736973.1 hypothetical protein [Klebsiella pneumoniae]
MKLKLIAALAVGASLLSGCATMPSGDKIDYANYGNAPGSDYAQKVQEVMKQGLKDPYSAVIVITKPPFKFWMDEPGIKHLWNGDLAIGYAVTGTINTKNSYGAYIGEKPFTVLFRNNGQILNVTPWLDSMPHGEKADI